MFSYTERSTITQVNTLAHADDIHRCCVHHAVTRQPASAAQHCGIPLGSVLRMSTLREHLKRAILFSSFFFFKHAPIHSLHLRYSLGWQLVFFSSQLCVIHDECMTLDPGREWCFCWITFVPPESGVGMSDTLTLLDYRG